ncbi:MAG: hypothetical protein ABSD47_15865 [Candidatus Methylomirabilota bacterium]|jgi:hypothetical protein
MTYAREHRRAVRRIKAKETRREGLRNWEKKRLQDDGQDTSKAEKK